MGVTSDCKEILRLRLLGHPGKAVVMAIAAEAVSDEAKLTILLELLYDGGAPVNARAAWVLEKVSAISPSLLMDERSRMIKFVMQPDVSSGLRRLLLSILWHLPDGEVLDVSFFNFLLDKMCDMQSPPGVQALAMKVACRMSSIDADLHREFLCILRNMELDYCSAGVRSAVRNCLKWSVASENRK